VAKIEKVSNTEATKTGERTEVKRRGEQSGLEAEYHDPPQNHPGRK
jgi:hypothetical protein